MIKKKKIRRKIIYGLSDSFLLLFLYYTTACTTVFDNICKNENKMVNPGKFLFYSQVPKDLDKKKYMYLSFIVTTGNTCLSIYIRHFKDKCLRGVLVSSQWLLLHVFIRMDKKHHKFKLKWCK